MPVTNLTISKRPSKSRPCHPFLDHRVFIDIFIVVVVDKPIPKRLTENNPDSQRNEDANPDDFPDGGLFPCFVIHWCLPNHLAFLRQTTNSSSCRCGIRPRSKAWPRKRRIASLPLSP